MVSWHKLEKIILEQPMAENKTNSSVEEISEEGNAYEFLMKDALERKPSVFEVILLVIIWLQNHNTTSVIVKYCREQQPIPYVRMMSSWSKILSWWIITAIFGARFSDFNIFLH